MCHPFRSTRRANAETTTMIGLVLAVMVGAGVLFWAVGSVFDKVSKPLEPVTSPPPEPATEPENPRLVERDGVRIELIDVGVGPVRLSDTRDNSKSLDTARRHTFFVVEITNLSDSQTLHYDGWRDSWGTATLTDDLANFYRHSDGLRGPDITVMGYPYADATIQPGKSTVEVIVFDPPAEKAEVLTLTLPGKTLRRPMGEFAFSLVTDSKFTFDLAAMELARHSR